LYTDIVFVTLEHRLRSRAWNWVSAFGPTVRRC